MSSILSIDIVNQLETQYRSVREEAYTAYQLLSDAQDVTRSASLAYFALTPYSDNRDAHLASTAYHTAIINEEPLRQRFNAKVAELNTIKEQLALARMG